MQETREAGHDVFEAKRKFFELRESSRGGRKARHEAPGELGVQLGFFFKS